jgi:hypothetical protein
MPSVDPSVNDEALDVLDDPKRSLEEILDVMKYD